LKLFVEFSTKVEIYSHIQWENAVDRSSGWSWKSGLH
jgi:hypothetical protein